MSQLDTGLEPQHIDEQVRFRTTLLFSCFEGCPLDKNDDSDISKGSPFANRISGDFVPLSDSLYRFRMTEQAAALFNKSFEPDRGAKIGLTRSESTVHYNQKDNSFPVKRDAQVSPDGRAFGRFLSNPS